MGANKVDRKEQMLGYLFIVPAVVYMLIFIGYPIIYNWIVSFQDVTAMTLGSDARDFLGFANYRAVFAAHICHLISGITKINSVPSPHWLLTSISAFSP